MSAVWYVLALDRGLGRLCGWLTAAAAVVAVAVAGMLVLPIALLSGGGVARPLSGLPGGGAGTASVARVPLGDPPPASGADGAQVAAVARRYLGVPYVWGGSSPAGLDCSGLVWVVFRQLGVSLPRTAQQQYNATQRLAQAAVQPGDLVFFAQTYPDPADWITHVGIYVGDGQMINAPTTGDVVRVMPVWSGFWGSRYAGAGRVLG